MAGVVSPAPAGKSIWPFNVPADYVISDATRVEVAGGVVRLIPVDQTDDDGSALGFGGGTHNQTQWNGTNGWLELVAGAGSGEFTSRVMDAGASTSRSSISWVPRRPYLKELPNYKGIEPAYSAGNADMTGNVFLAHLNGSPATDGSAVPDSSGESNHGVLYTGEGMSDKSTGGMYGAALAFDGVDDYVEIPDDPALDVTDEVTVEAWINPTAAGGSVGEIASSTIDDYEFDVTRGYDPDLVHVSGDVYAVAYCGADNHGWLATTIISADGSITSAKVDSLEFDDRRGVDPCMVHVSGDVYAVAYSGMGADGWLKTVRISQGGTIDNAAMDSFEFGPDRCFTPDMIHVSGDTYAIAYTSRGNRGWLATVSIASDGSIGAATLDDFEFDTGRGVAPRITAVEGDVYAIAYSGPGGGGRLATVTIASDGAIGGSVMDDLEFETSTCSDPDIMRVSGDVYAVAYSGPDTDGWVVTVRIGSNGAIGPGTLDSAEFDPVNALAPAIFHVARDVYGIAYGGPDDDGWLITVHIADGGTITGAEDILEYDASRGLEACVVRVAGDVYAIAYCGVDGEGLLASCEILTDRGITKPGAYAIDADLNNAYARINSATISASISAAWTHVALVYERDAGSNQQRLYVNGTLAATGSLAVTIESVPSPLIVGKRLGGAVDEVAVFDRALSPAEIADHYGRAALRMRYQVRSGATDPPTGAFIGPDGTAATYYSELMNGTVGPPSLALANVGEARYFQYRAYLNSYDLTNTPEIESVSVGPAHYPMGNPTVENATGQAYVSLLSFSETLGPGNAGSVGYQISNDGSSWYYWNGSAWVGATGYSQTNTAAEISSNCGAFDDDVGSGEFFFKAFLHADQASQQVELDRLDLAFVAVVISVAVDNSTFSFGTKTLDTWLSPDSTVLYNDGTVVEDFLGRISQFSEGVEVWGISDLSNAADVIRAQWSTAGPSGPWNDISAYDADFPIESAVAASDSITLWFRILTPTSTSSFDEYSSTLTVKAQQN